jgi:peptide/nickel transport system substrate-binding protein
METTYKLKPNLTWHDGQSLTADDFVFAQRMYTHPELGMAGLPPQNLIDEVVAVDARTLLLRWRQPYAEAGSLSDSFPPVPRHILESTMDSGSMEALTASPFWTTQYVGAGPFKLERWETGSFFEGSAFDGNALGRPKIDRVRFLFILDNNAIVANLISGAGDYVSDSAIRFQHAQTVKRDWDQRKAGTVYATPQQIRMTQFQFRPEVLAVPALLDVRMRRAIAYATNREAQVEALYNDQGRVADTFISPQLEAYPAVERAITKYPLDLRRTEQLLGELGYARGPSGFYEHPVDGRLVIEMNVHGGSAETELAVMEDGFRQAGIEVKGQVISRIMLQDPQITSSFPGLRNGTYNDVQHPPEYTTANISSAQTRWIGSNSGAWSSARFDRVYEAFNKALDRDERNARMVEALQMMSEEMSLMPRFYDFIFDAFSSDLVGPVPGGRAWNVEQWELR